MKLLALCVPVVAALAIALPRPTSFQSVNDRDVATVYGGACYKKVDKRCGGTGRNCVATRGAFHDTSGSGSVDSAGVIIACSSDGSTTCGTTTRPLACLDVTNP